MQRISIDRLRSKLGEVIRECSDSGQEVEVTVYGIPAVRIIPLVHTMPIPREAVSHMAVPAQVPGQQELPFADNSKKQVKQRPAKIMNAED